MSSLNFHHLRYFWAVAHEGNLTRASERLFVSQSSVSAQIKKLEEDVGHPLFERTGRQLILTEAGRIALEYADSIFATGDELVSVLRERPASAKKVIRVGAIATLSRNFQIGFLGEMIQREDVEVIVRSGSLSSVLDALATHQVDIVLANQSPRRDAATPWVPHLIATQPVSLVGKKRRRRSLERLLSEEALVVPTLESSIRTGFDALVTRLDIRPQIAAEVDDMAMLRLVARSHEGLSVVPPIVVKDELDSGELVEVERLPGLEETFYAITATRRFPNPLLAELLGSARSEST